MGSTGALEELRSNFKDSGEQFVMISSTWTMLLWFVTSWDVEVPSVSLDLQSLEQVLDGSGLMICPAMEMSQLFGTVVTEDGEAITVLMVKMLE